MNNLFLFWASSISVLLLDVWLVCFLFDTVNTWRMKLLSKVVYLIISILSVSWLFCCVEFFLIKLILF